MQAKTYWSILKTFYNDKKIPLIPSFLVSDNHVTNIKTKANFFNECFAEQYTLLKNNSVLLINQTFLCQSTLTSLDFDKEKILKIIRALNIHKAHCHDNISTRMIKTCDKSLLQPLIYLFQNSAKLLFPRYMENV